MSVWVHPTAAVPLLQADRAGSGVNLVTHYPHRSVPIHTLWKHLVSTPSLPMNLSLRVEVDGVLEDRVHRVVMRSHCSGGAWITCAPAFRPLVGKQHVAWRLLLPNTLVYAVRTAAGPAATSHGMAARHTAAAAGVVEEDEWEEEEEVGEEEEWEEEVEEEDEGEEGEEEEEEELEEEKEVEVEVGGIEEGEEEGGKKCGGGAAAPPVSPPPSYAHPGEHTAPKMTTIKVGCSSLTRNDTPTCAAPYFLTHPPQPGPSLRPMSYPPLCPTPYPPKPSMPYTSLYPTPLSPKLWARPCMCLLQRHGSVATACRLMEREGRSGWWHN